MSRYVSGIGHPLLDITVTVDEDFLERYGLNPNDQTLCDNSKNHDQIYTEIMEQDSPESQVLYTPGGSTFNTVNAAAWFLKGQEQYQSDADRQKCLFTGSVSKDHYAKLLRERGKLIDLKFHEVGKADLDRLNEEERRAADSMMDANNNLSTGICAVLLNDDGRNRSLVTNLGAAKIFSNDNLQSVKPALLDCRVLYCSGFFLNTFGGPETVKEIGASLSPNQILATNLSAPFLAFVKKAELDMMISYSSFVIGNIEEAMAWASSHGFEGLDAAEIATKFAEMPHLRSSASADESVWNREVDGDVSRVAIITQGSDDIVVAISRTTSQCPKATGEGASPALSKTEVRRYPTRKVEKVVDTNCAGDTFAGAFLAALSLEKTIDECVNAGNYAASIVIQDHGCKLPEKCGFRF